MTNQNDSFIREVNEELRSDQMRAVWTQYGLIVVAIAVAIVIGTAGYRGYVYWSGKQASASGDKFLTAMKLASDNKTDEALAAFAQLEKDGYGSYPVLARMRAASLKAATDPRQPLSNSMRLPMTRRFPMPCAMSPVFAPAGC